MKTSLLYGFLFLAVSLAIFLLGCSILEKSGKIRASRKKIKLIANFFLGWVMMIGSMFLAHQGFYHWSFTAFSPMTDSIISSVLVSLYAFYITRSSTRKAKEARK